MLNNNNERNGVTTKFETPEASNVAWDLKILAYTAPECHMDLVTLCVDPSHKLPPEHEELLLEENLLGPDRRPPRSVRFVVSETIRPPT